MFAPEDGTHPADWAHVVNTVAPELLDDLGNEPLPRDAGFLAEMSKDVDPAQAELLFSIFEKAGVAAFSRGSFNGTLSNIFG